MTLNLCRRLLGFGLSCTLLLAMANTAEAEEPAAPQRSRPYIGFRYATVTPQTKLEVIQIWRTAEHVLAPHDPRLARHELIVSPKSLAALQALGLRLEVDPIDVQALVDKSYEPEPPSLSGTLRAYDKLNLFGTWFSKVQTLSAIETRLAELDELAGERAELVELGKSIENREILALRLGSEPEGADRPSIIVLGTQHAREWASPMVTMAIADALVRQHDDPKVRKVVDYLQIYIVPVANPDGYVATHNGERMQRKNMRPGCNVDLNRNYDAGFGQGVDGSCNGETYPGEEAFSEPETQAIKKLIESLRRPELLYDYHSFAAQVMIPFAYTREKPPEYERNRQLGLLYSETLEALNGSDVPALDGFELGAGSGGGAIDWFRSEHSHSLAIELRDGGTRNGFDIDGDEIIEQAEENYAAWLAVASELADVESKQSPIDTGSGGQTSAAGSSNLGGVAGASDNPGSFSNGGAAGSAGGALQNSGGEAGVAGTTGEKTRNNRTDFARNDSGCACRQALSASAPHGGSAWLASVWLLLVATFRRRSTAPR